MWVVYWNEQRESFHIARTERANKRHLKIFETFLYEDDAVDYCITMNKRMIDDDESV